MHRYCWTLLALSLLGLAVKADDKPASGETFASIKAEFEAANNKFVAERQKEMKAQQEAIQAKVKAAQEAVNNAKTDEEKAAAQKQLTDARSTPMKAFSMADSPIAAFAPRFLAFAENNPKNAAALDSLSFALRAASGSKDKSTIFTQVIKNLRTSYMQNADVKKLFSMLANSMNDDALAFLREVIAKHSDRTTQAKACKQLANGLNNLAQQADYLSKNPAIRPRAEAQLGKEAVEALLAKADKYKTDAEELSKMVKDKFSDVFPDLSVGKTAPEVINKDLDDKTVKLSDLKGRVVVLDIWATWCGPCRAMIPHEREMVEKLKAKPFTLVSVSADAEKKTLTDFIKKEPMPWTHWWNGQQGGILEDWDVQYFPTIYVIDAKGVIRYKDVRGKELEEAVEKLLEEAGK
ncbi:MAG: TlpA disulfide reductase family protein [Gemmatales bacterium]